jgi:hypothetical protein
MENNKKGSSKEEEEDLKSMLDITETTIPSKESHSRRGNTEFVKPQVDEQAIMRMIAGEKPENVGYNPVQGFNKKETTGSKKQFTKPEYFQKFFKIPMQTASKGKSVYLRPEHHQKFMRMISVLGIEKMTIYAYVDNIIEHHFKEFEKLISEIFDENNSPLF